MIVFVEMEAEKAVLTSLEQDRNSQVMIGGKEFERDVQEKIQLSRLAE